MEMRLCQVTLKASFAVGPTAIPPALVAKTRFNAYGSENCDEYVSSEEDFTATDSGRNRRIDAADGASNGFFSHHGDGESVLGFRVLKQS